MRVVTRIHRLSHLSAEEVATGVLSKLATKDASIVPYAPSNVLVITETASNLRRMLEILSAIDEAGEEDKLWLQPLTHVSASQVEKQLRDVLGLEKKGPEAAPGPLHVGRIVAIERPNALAIVATRASYERIVEVLARLDVAPSSEPQVRVVMLQHSEAKKLVGPINEALVGGSPPAQNGAAGKAPGATVLEGSVKVAADETTNSLIVTASARDYVQIKAVIDALDRAKRQVYIEAVVLDVSSEHGLDLGAAFHGGDVSDASIGPSGKQQTTYGGFRPLTSAAPGTGDLQAFALGVRGPEIPFSGVIPGVSRIPSFGLLLTAVAQSKSADILSTPHILASDNTPAEIRVQLQTSLQPNAPQTSILPGGGASTVVPNAGSSVASNYRPIGPKIKVTPHLNDSNEVRLDVDELISDVQSQPDRGDVYGTVSYLERAASTTLTVKDGETVVIGGLVRNRTARSETKVPILGDIPLVGALFRTRSDRVEKSNLVLVLTPHIIRDQTDLRAIFERKMQERQEMLDREAIFSEAQKWSPPKDWRRTRGLLADTRLAHRDVDRRRTEAAALAPRPVEPTATAPLDLPVPQGSARGDRPPSPAPPAPAKPSVVER
jgi:general secretion pathway protein D